MYLKTLIVCAVLSLGVTHLANAGSTSLENVVFIDYSKDKTGALSYKNARVKNQDTVNPCWTYIDIQTVYISNIPKQIDQKEVLSAVNGNKTALKNLRKTLSSQYDQIYAFVPTSKGNAAHIYGISLYNKQKIYKSKLIPIQNKQLISPKILSRRLCEATDLVEHVRINGI